MIPAYTLAAEEGGNQEPRTWVSKRDDPISINIWKVFWYQVH